MYSSDQIWLAVGTLGLALLIGIKVFQRRKQKGHHQATTKKEAQPRPRLSEDEVNARFAHKDPTDQVNELLKDGFGGSADTQIGHNGQD